MLMYAEPTNAEEVKCPYIDGEMFRQRYTLISELTPTDFDFMLLNGWRHFGYYFFMPNCIACNACTPIRTVVSKFKPSKSQRRNINKNSSLIACEFVPPIYTDEIFEVYKKHSKVKFNQDCNVEEFKESFFQDALNGNSKISMYRKDGVLVGVGFLDISETAVSSIYFCYDTDYSSYGLGVYSVLNEIAYSQEIGKDFYYLGYYIEGNGSMEYKARYTPSETLNWAKNLWEPFK